MTFSAPVLLLADATPDDMAAVQQIYAHHVLHGAASFEETPPTLAEMQQRLGKVREAGLPWLVARSESRILGYCYATPYRPRPAYRYTVEDSVYVAPGQQGNGIGQALLAALIARCEQGPWRQMLAIVGDAAANRGSLALHQKLGFHSVGTLKAVGFKLGEWRDTHIMQRTLGDGGDSRP
ncbi:Phosphinothricin N-acetyltransferase [Serratia entomophila]|uniref:GNAT family N-acetyltransferase n=1 Tax=Serratia entomophila TaxID=42906 RepID=UPI001F35729D|nr:GNAT family N-acetyltransferase [Serratia entomophila]UIW19683.1 GNAT family N-acetyltransferase [Serratia entomophila]CAI0709797.1 Phosphinothricin N-acetyltransferase [Serratia entomophila]CAI0782824.1 Phosphinothricin N-acetyltransferase [Serratia entomophila]CAI0783099.1 Phosphinothricin N-acetyltransferase [Serratia entomophila]CAI0783618.1 Phosphinothricin N-acetyltransferase [Serratia entomophila]